MLNKKEYGCNLLYPKNTVMTYRRDPSLSYTKMDNNAFGLWHLTSHLNRPEDKRTGFKWTDDQVKDYFTFMTFITL